LSEQKTVRLKSPEDIERIHASGRISGALLVEIQDKVKPGVSTKELDEWAETFIRKHGGVPTFLGYRGYPASLCTSLNEEIVHGIPSRKRIVKDGDILKLDVGVTLDGYISDTAVTYLVGDDDKRKLGLMEATRNALGAAIDAMAPGRHLSDISNAVQCAVESRGFRVIRDLTGHGTGYELHEDPPVFNYGPSGQGPVLSDGWVLALEPMASVGTSEIICGADKWTYMTLDGSWAAHYEHTVAILNGQTVVLTDVNTRTVKEVIQT
jgi:methionyl aminopeptidase